MELENGSSNWNQIDFSPDRDQFHDSSNWNQIDDNSNWNQLVIVPIISVLTSPGCDAYGSNCNQENLSRYS